MLLQAADLTEGVVHSLRVRASAAANPGHLRALDACPLREGEDLVSWMRRLALLAEPTITRDFLIMTNHAVESVGQQASIRR